MVSPHFYPFFNRFGGSAYTDETVTDFLEVRKHKETLQAAATVKLITAIMKEQNKERTFIYYENS